VAIVLLLLFLSSATRLVATLVGGAGFGAFIDELGKFVTSDNDYFFKPTAAFVYVTFVLLFLAVRQVRTFRALSPQENLVNALELSERLVLGRLGESDRVRAVELLRRADQTEPMVAALRTRFAEAAPSTGAPSGARRLSLAASRRYAAIAGSRWFGRLIAAIFILDGLGFVLTVVAGLALVVGVLIGNAEARAAFDETTAGSTVPSLIQVLAGVVAGGMVVAGLVALRRSRSRAYRLFELAILVDLLLVQPFSFLDSTVAIRRRCREHAGLVRRHERLDLTRPGGRLRVHRRAARPQRLRDVGEVRRGRPLDHQARPRSELGHQGFGLAVGRHVQAA